MINYSFALIKFYKIERRKKRNTTKEEMISISISIIICNRMNKMLKHVAYNKHYFLSIHHWP